MMCSGTTAYDVEGIFFVARGGGVAGVRSLYRRSFEEKLGENSQGILKPRYLLQ